MSSFPGGSFPDAEIVATESEVEQAYERLAAALQPVISSHDCVVAAILLGGMAPTVRLAGMLTGDFTIDCCQVSRYRGGTKGGQLEWVKPLGADIKGRTVCLVDDIFDEGVTLDYVASACYEQGAEQVVSTVLVRKRHDRAIDGVRPDIVGLEVADHYVFGCGMDYQHRWRHLPAIYAIKDEN